LPLEKAPAKQRSFLLVRLPETGAVLFLYILIAFLFIFISLLFLLLLCLLLFLLIRRFIYRECPPG